MVQNTQIDLYSVAVYVLYRLLQRLVRMVESINQSS